MARAYVAVSRSLTIDQIAEGLAAWRDEGVDEVMCRQEPASADLVERIARAAEQLR